MLLLQYALTLSRKRNEGELWRGEEKGKGVSSQNERHRHVCQRILSGAGGRRMLQWGKYSAFLPSRQICIIAIGEGSAGWSPTCFAEPKFPLEVQSFRMAEVKKIRFKVTCWRLFW